MAARPSSTSRSNKNFRSVSAKIGPASGTLAVWVSAPGRHKALTVERRKLALGVIQSQDSWIHNLLPAPHTEDKGTAVPPAGRPAQLSAPQKTGQPGSPQSLHREVGERGGGLAWLSHFQWAARPLCGRKKRNGPEKRHRKETKKEGWCLDEEEWASVGENTAYVTFKAWNLLTSRGLHIQCPFSRRQLRRRRQPLCKHFVRQGSTEVQKTPTLTAKKEENDKNGLGVAKEGVYFLSLARKLFWTLLPKGRSL